MFSRELKDNEALILANKKESVENAIHTFFVFYPIDVLWLDKNFKVVYKRESLKPFTFSAKPKKASKYIIELRKGKSRNINIGDKLKFV